MNILFICTENKHRSKTAEDLVKNTEHAVKSAGISEFATHKVTKDDIGWSDRIYVMEKVQKDYLENMFPVMSKSADIRVVGITDSYPYMDFELVEILGEKLPDDVLSSEQIRYLTR